MKMVKSTNINNRRYLGNKYKLLPFIKSVVNNECHDINVVVDIFAGTGAVASAFQDKQLITNDILYSNYISNFAWFSPKRYSKKRLRNIIQTYNSMEINEENYMTQNFSNTYFCYEDCAKIGYIREDIENKFNNKEINERERALLITSLLYAMDKIAKTCGHYDAYRKGVKFDMHLELLFPDASKSNNKKNRCYNEYEKGTDSYFCRITSLAETLACYEEQVEQIEQEISAEFSDAPLDQISQIVADRRRLEFVNFIAKEYPIDKVKFILGLFGDRSNDNKIKAIVSKDATVPTIYEYIVGLAWYYFSGKRIDLLASYNLSLSANFEPLVHAGGGQGDIVIYEDEKVVMLEATLMNANSQKRGEWEPVLRHSINLKIEEESKNTGRGVTSFFIADSFDYNTINIWKAIAGVPLQSSIDKTRFTDNVVIMPVNTDELIILMDKANDYDSIISKVHELFEVDKVKFDIQWRDKFMNTII